MACAVRDSAHVEPAEARKDTMAKIEDDEDLFEIDLEAVNNIPPPYYWDSYVTATGNALMANCLLPISDVSGAVPMVSEACNALSLAGTAKLPMAVESIPLEKLLSFAVLRASGGSSSTQANGSLI